MLRSVLQRHPACRVHAYTRRIRSGAPPPADSLPEPAMGTKKAATAKKPAAKKPDAALKPAGGVEKAAKASGELTLRIEACKS